MAKRRVQALLDGYRFKPPVHDHFNGSAHCVECNGGDCRLKGADMAYTALVRWLFEAEAFGGNHIPYLVVNRLKDVINVEKFRERARLTHATKYRQFAAAQLERDREHALRRITRLNA